MSQVSQLYPSWRHSSWVYSGQRPEWANQADEALYVLTVADLITTYEEDNEGKNWDDMTPSQQEDLIREARAELEHIMDGGTCGWVDVLQDVIAAVVGEETKS